MKRCLLVLMVVLSVLAVGQPARASATTGRQILEHWQVTLDGIYPMVECVGEGLAAHEVEEFELARVTDAAGGSQFELRMTDRGTATGLATGTPYRISGVNTWTGTSRPESGSEVTLEGHGTLISQGGIDNLVTRVLVHLTQTANGEWTASVSTLDSKCGG